MEQYNPTSLNVQSKNSLNSSLRLRRGIMNSFILESGIAVVLVFVGILLGHFLTIYALTIPIGY